MDSEVFNDPNIPDTSWSSAYTAGVRKDYFSDLTFLDQFKCFLNRGVKSFHEAHRKFNVMFLSCLDELFSFCDGISHRFLYKDMFTCFNRH